MVLANNLLNIVCTCCKMPFQNTPEASRLFLVAHMAFSQVGRNVRLEACDLIRDTGLMAVVLGHTEEVIASVVFRSFVCEVEENVL